MSKLKLTDREWTVFNFSDVFDIQSTSSGIDKIKLAGGDGETPYVTRTDINNGIDSFIELGQSKPLDDGNSLSIGLDTQTIFYQPTSFYTGQNIHIVKHESLNKYVAQFLRIPFKTMLAKFSWGSYGATLSRVKKSKLILPADKSGDPDWAFMDAYMRQVEAELLADVVPYFTQRIESPERERLTLGSREWRQYRLDDIAFIRNSVRLTKADSISGERPFVGATEQNNGITNFVGNDNSSRDNNVLGVNYNGSVGFAFYHPYEALFSDDVKRVEWKDASANNKYSLLFLSSAIMKQRTKYAYGYKMNANRMNKQIILLPISKAGKPDYDFMEAYMQQEERDLIRDYLICRKQLK